jgi:hypothetical protein
LQEVIKCDGKQTPACACNGCTNLSGAFANEQNNKEDTSTEADYIDYWLNLVQNVSPGAGCSSSRQLRANDPGAALVHRLPLKREHINSSRKRYGISSSPMRRGAL